MTQITQPNYSDVGRMTELARRWRKTRGGSPSWRLHLYTYLEGATDILAVARSLKDAEADLRLLISDIEGRGMQAVAAFDELGSTASKTMKALHASHAEHLLTPDLVSMVQIVRKSGLALIPDFEIGDVLHLFMVEGNPHAILHKPNDGYQIEFPSGVTSFSNLRPAMEALADYIEKRSFPIADDA